MTVSVDMGTGPTGQPVSMDLEELLATRLLVQGNSGSGKSHLLRRLLEMSAGQVQQIVIDPEGDFVTLSDKYGQVNASPLMSGRQNTVEFRQLGMMIGVELTVDATPLVQACMDRGLLINVTQGNVIRLLPALTSSEAEVREGCAILVEAIRSFKA